MSIFEMKAKTTLSDLPDDCLREIFLHLSLLERINIRQVCKRWKGVSDDCWSDVKSISVDDGDKTGVTGDGRNIGIKSSNKLLVTECIKRCARYVRKLGDTRWQGDEYYSTLEDIELLQESGEKNYFSILPALELSDKIQELKLRQETPFDDLHISTLFNNNEKLKRLWIDINEESRCLENLSTKHLKELEIYVRNSDGHPYDSRLLETLKEKLLNSQKLEQLTISTVNDELFHVISQMHSLKYLRTGRPVHHSSTPGGLISITELHNLRTLNVADYSKQLINDEFLVKLSQNCVNLEKLTLDTFGYQITDDGLLALSRLKQLKELAITNLYSITGKYLGHFAEVERLTIIDSKIIDDGVVALLRNSQTLTYLYLSYCEVTNYTINVAIEEMEKRTNGIPLEIILDKAKVNFSEVKNPLFPQLRIKSYNAEIF